ncbi:MAG: hypothetical protein HZB75_03295 [Candidatus Saccharibacteria bacterium]|nr:MAG: hypothetical protein HZB75_03295 [Candidatus Saccharibacteria bacterium]
MTTSTLRKFLSIVFAIVAIALVGYAAIQVFTGNPVPSKIRSFDECAAAGYPIQDSYPERCSVPGGDTFTNQ